MEILNRQELINFIESDLDEFDYFYCKMDNRKNAIQFGYYVGDLIERNKEYYRLAKSFIDSIKEKNDWVTDVKPNPSTGEGVLLIDAINNPGIQVGKKNPIDKNSPYILRGAYAHWGLISKIQLNSRLKKRIDVLSNSPEEIIQIGKIAKELGYSIVNDDTISKKFKYDIQRFFGERSIISLKYCSHRYIDINLSSGKIEDTSMLSEQECKPISEEQRNKLLSKLYVRKN